MNVAHVHEFGNLQDNHGWVQCRSKTYPNRVYFYNTNSGCATWYRPVSRYVDIPFVSLKKRVTTSSDDLTTGDLELMSVSDNEKEPATHDRSIKAATAACKNIIARYYYTPRMDKTSDTDETVASTQTNSDNNNNNDDNNNYDDDSNSRSEAAPANFLEADFFVAEGKVDIKSATFQIFESPKLDDDDDDDVSDDIDFTSSNRRSHVVYGVPRLTKISMEHQLIKPTRQPTRVVKKKSSGTRDRVPTKKIISNMYGVKTISYDLPGPEQVRAQLGVKFSTLTDSDSDDDDEPPSQRARTARSLEAEWHDIGQNLVRPLLLSDLSSSPSARSATSSSATSRTTDCTSCSCSTCD